MSVDGLLVVDKPGGWTSHDVVAKVRRLAGTRRVGHAGTLDPMATGVLVLGLGRGTRLLGHLALDDKEYLATIRLGVRTATDDADGEVVECRDAAGVLPDAVAGAMAALTGEISQVPCAVSAIKVGGRRAYARVRAGETVELAPRRVRVDVFELLARCDGGGRPGPSAPAPHPGPCASAPHPGPCAPAPHPVDLDVRVVCSTGTYVRALARDLGASLGTGACLTALRRTRSGQFALDQAQTLDELAGPPAAPEAAPAEAGAALQAAVVPLSVAVATAFPRRDVDEAQARAVAHGGRLPAAGIGPGPYGVFGPDGHALALVEERGGLARPLAVFVGAPGS